MHFPVRHAIFFKLAIASLIAPVDGVRAEVAAPDREQKVGAFLIDRTEVSIADFARFAAATSLRTKAEREGGGLVYEAGWTKKPGWTWRHPFGRQQAGREQAGLLANGNEPAVHVTFDEAQAYCRWAGKRLPSDREWTQAAYVESRTNPSAPFVAGKTYPYPTGESPAGANCLEDCGSSEAIDYSIVLARGRGPTPVGATQRGVNGLYDMGGNVWEWVDTDVGGEKITRGGSWWYGAAQMHRGYRATKPPGMAVVYIGFRCARDAGK